MSDLTDFRAKYPQYDDWSDQQVADKLHAYYPEMPKDAFYKKLGFDPEQSKLKEVGQGLLRGGKDLLAGLAGVGHEAINAPHNLAALFSQKLASHIPTQTDFDYSAALGLPENKQNLADKLIQAAPNLAVTMGFPEARLGALGKAVEAIPKAGKYLKTGLGNALSQGLLGAATAPTNQGEATVTAGGIAGPLSILAKGTAEADPLVRNISRALMGLGSGALGYAGAKALGAGTGGADIGAALGALGGYRGISPNRRAAEDVLKGVEGTDYQSALDAAKRLGLSYLTPAEASGNPFTGGVQGNVGKTEEGAQMLYKAGQGRAASEKQSINDLLKNIFNTSVESPDIANKNAFYKAADPILVPNKQLEEFRGTPDKENSGNEVFKDAEKAVLKDSAYREKLKGVDPNSIEYLHQIKYKMDKMINEAYGAGDNNRADIIRNTQNKLLDMMDTAAPDYKQGRALAEREIARRQIEKYFDTRQMTGTNMAKFLNNDNRYEELQNNLRNVPNAQNQLADMRQIFGRLINIPTAKTAEALSRSSMSKERSSMQSAMMMFKEALSGGKYDKTAVELITNPNWADELQKLKQVTKPEKLAAKFYNLLGRAGAQEAAKKVSQPPMEIDINKFAGYGQ